MMIDALGKSVVTDLLARADITCGGENPWDITVHDEAFYRRLLLGGSIGLGDSYVEGLWDCPALDQMFFRILRRSHGTKALWNPARWLHRLHGRLGNRQSPRRAFDLRHYDIGNDLFQHMLDSRMVYSCGWWQDAEDLEAAQQAKLELVCRKLGLKPGMRVLDIGCGWGSFMKYASERYGVSCVGVTISPAQIELGRQMCAGLPIEFRLLDYRRLDGRYDAIASIGMFEHVGRRNYRRFMEIARTALARDGLMLLHTIGAKTSRAVDAADPWLSRTIFLNGELAGMKQIVQAADGLLTIEDWHNFGADYDRTLMAWHASIERAWPLLGARYDESFRRMWCYYLLCCAGLFRARAAQLWQIVFSRKGMVGGYRSIR